MAVALVPARLLARRVTRRSAVSRGAILPVTSCSSSSSMVLSSSLSLSLSSSLVLVLVVRVVRVVLCDVRSKFSRQNSQ